MNKYRGLRIPEEPGEQPISLHHAQLDLGLRGDLMPRQIPEGSSPNLWDVRFERGGFRKDFGEKFLGQAAPTTVLVIVEHKFIDEGVISGGYEGYSDYGSYAAIVGQQQFHRLVRLFRNALGQAELEVWDSSIEQWVFGGIATNFATGEPVQIESRYVRAVSVQNLLLFAVAGASILIREESPILDQTGDDFPSENELTSVDDSTTAVFSSVEPIHFNRFTVNFSIDISIEEPEVVVVTLDVDVNGENVTSLGFQATGPDGMSQDHASIEFTRALAVNDDVTLKIASIETDAAFDRDANLTQAGGSDPLYIAEKTTEAPAIGNNYTFRYMLQAAEGTYPITVNFFRWDSGTSTWNIVDSKEHDFEDDLEILTHTVNIPEMEQGDFFGIEDADATNLDGFEVSWQDQDVDITVSVKGFNLTEDNDPAFGLAYAIEEGTDLDFEEIEGPEALWIEPFADRVIALVDGPNTQSIWWTPSGDVKNWDPFAEGAGQMDLFDTRNDPIDDLQCAAPLSSDSLAIFRHRSIMRAFRTGQSIQAIGVNHWLENIGTESPFSRQVTPIGIIFLGHDRMVYILSESGIRPVGQPIHQILIERLTSNLEIVDSVFDPVFQHYYLGIPVFGSQLICEVYILDVARLMNEDKIVWRRRSCGNGLQRFALASEL